MEIDTVKRTVNEVEHGMAFKPIDLKRGRQHRPDCRPGYRRGDGRDRRATKGLGRLDGALRA
jgi:hypothetical protein